MKNFLKFLSPYKWWVLLTVVFIALQSFSDLYLPDLNATIIDDGVMQGDVGTILLYGGIMLLVALLVGACTLGTTYFSTKASLAYGRDMRLALFTKVQSFSQSDLDRFGTPSLITRTTNDVNQLQQTMQMLLRTIITTPILLFGGIIMCLKQDVELSVILLFVIPIIGVVVVFTTKKSHPWFKKQQKQVDILNQVLREKLSGIRVIRAFVRTDYEEQRYDKENKEMLRIAVHAHKLMTALMPLVSLVMNGATLAAYYMGALRIDSFGMEIGALTAFVTYLMQILMSVMASSMMMNMIPRAMTSVGRINEVLDYTPSVQDAAGTDHRDIGAFTGLEFRDVSFHYPEADRPVLEHVSFVTKPGETTAIIGSTGSGKSTLVNLIPGSTTPRRDRSSSTAWTSRNCPRRSFASIWAWYPRRRCSLTARWHPTSAMARRTPRRRRCGTRWRWPRARTSCLRWLAAWRRPSPRAAPTFPAVSVSVWPLPGRLSGGPMCISLTTAFPLWTSRPTPGSGRRWPRRPGERRC